MKQDDDSTTTLPVTAAPPTRRLGALRCPNAASIGWCGVEPSCNSNGAASAAIAATKCNNGGTREGVTTAKGDIEGSLPSPPVVETTTKTQQIRAERRLFAENEVVKNEGESRKRPRNVESGWPGAEAMTGGGSPCQCRGVATEARDGLPLQTIRSQRHQIKAALEDFNDGSCGRSQVLTITYRGGVGDSDGDGDRDVALLNSSTLVGSLSGRATLSVLPERDFSSLEAATPRFALDVFGHRMTSENENESGPLIIQRPEAVSKALPISVVCTHIPRPLDSAEHRVRPATVVLRVKVNSISFKGVEEEKYDNRNDGGIDHSANPDKSYKLQLLPLSLVSPGNGNAAAVGSTLVLEPWKDALDAILAEGNSMRSRRSSSCTEGRGIETSTPQLEDAEENAPSPQRPVVPSQGKRHKIMVCGGE